MKICRPLGNNNRTAAAIRAWARRTAAPGTGAWLRRVCELAAWGFRA